MDANENPNLFSESGREHLSLADRLTLLENDLLTLQSPGYKRDDPKSWHPIHQFNALRGSIQACIRDVHRHLKFVQIKRDWSDTPIPTKSWGMLSLSKTECRILAWRRGGVFEHDRITKLAYPGKEA